MEKFDVIIIGAGPAGLKCAETLGNSSLRVLLLEKMPKLGQKFAPEASQARTLAFLDLPDELIEFRYNQIKLHVNGLSTTIKTGNDFAFTIDRRELGQWQLQKLKQFSNIEVRTNARVFEILNDAVVVDEQPIGYSFLVGADGSNSFVKRFLGFPPRNRGIGIQYIIPTERYRDFEFFSGPNILQHGMRGFSTSSICFDRVWRISRCHRSCRFEAEFSTMAVRQAYRYP